MLVAILVLAMSGNRRPCRVARTLIKKAKKIFVNTTKRCDLPVFKRTETVPSVPDSGPCNPNAFRLSWPAFSLWR